MSQEFTKSSVVGSVVASAEPPPPRVFISYSHDAPAHKQWVGELASTLVKKGIEVALDQWDLGPGDDVPKYMEKAVSESDRVLMICTETYVRKADDGKGGVGYEAMVVTSELIKDLGTAKFIPIVRQESGGTALPKCVSTRFWVNLSEGQNVGEQLEILLRELHNAPKLPKPPLGKNPFATEVAAEISGEKLIGVDIVPAAEKDPGNLFGTGLTLAKRDDLIGWRKLVQSTRQEMAKRLTVWREQYEGIGSLQIDTLPNIVGEAAAICSPIISLAVAGAVSGNNRFGNQAGILDELKRPAKWNPSGYVYLSEIPAALTFTFQAVHGAACLYSDQLTSAITLSRARIAASFSGDSEMLFKQPDIIGWPHSFGEKSQLAWSYLLGLFAKWTWISELFGSREEYAAALHAYYLALHIQELGDLLANGREIILDDGYYRPLVPVQGLFFDSEGKSRAYRMLIHDPSKVRAIWRSFGLSDSKMAAAWAKWLHATCRLSGSIYRTRSLEVFPHLHLFDDIRPEAK